MENNQVGAGVGIMILKKGRVLLGKRHDDPKKADSKLHGEGTWTMPGGKVHFGEKLKEGAKREVLEETSLKINSLKLMSVTDDILPDVHFITIGFLCEDFSGEPITMEPDEIIEWRWFSFDDLPKKIFFPSKKILDNYQANKIY